MDQTSSSTVVRVVITPARGHTLVSIIRRTFRGRETWDRHLDRLVLEDPADDFPLQPWEIMLRVAEHLRPSTSGS